MTDIVRFTGLTRWCEGGDVTEARIQRAILRSANELVLECESGGYRYTVTLRRASGSDFHGEFEAAAGKRRLRGGVACKLLRSGREAILAGTWNEEATLYQWWAILDEVDQFRD